MPQLRESYTAVLLRAERVADAMVTEPYEAGWANEAIAFATAVDGSTPVVFSVQISPDGMHWLDEGASLDLAGDATVAFARIGHFGNWLRLRAEVPEGESRRVTVTLHLKG